jgi:hypothetical protein
MGDNPYKPVTRAAAGISSIALLKHLSSSENFS